jgi:hypothetical protein
MDNLLNFEQIEAAKLSVTHLINNKALELESNK